MWLQSIRTRTEITEPILDCRFRCCIARWQRANGHAACERARCACASARLVSDAALGARPEDLQAVFMKIRWQVFRYHAGCSQAKRVAMPAGREHQRGQHQFVAEVLQRGRAARATHGTWRHKIVQPHLASHRELLRSCIGKVAAWINEVGWQGCGKSGK